VRVVEELEDGLYRWSARHPEWHPGEWGARVNSYAARVTAGHVVVVDPLLGEDPAPVWALLEDAARVTVAITIPYHVRDAEAVARRCGAPIVGHRGVARRLEDASGFEELRPGVDAGGLVAYAIGRPVRNERPLWIPSHRAVVFGDALVTTPSGELRIWHGEPVDEHRERFYAERFAPTLEPLVDLAPERILVTHGEPVLTGGATALRRALDAPPWYHRG
jgi:hypothetical protein